MGMIPQAYFAKHDRSKAHLNVGTIGKYQLRKKNDDYIYYTASILWIYQWENNAYNIK